MARHKTYRIVQEGGPAFGAYIKARMVGLVQVTTNDSYFPLAMLLGDDLSTSLQKGVIRLEFMHRIEKRRGRSANVWRVVTRAITKTCG